MSKHTTEKATREEKACAEIRAALALAGVTWQGKPAADLTDDETAAAVAALLRQLADALKPVHEAIARSMQRMVVSIQPVLDVMPPELLARAERKAKTR